MVKLDRVLYNQEWDEAFPSCLLQAISSEMSDHCPILLSSDAGFKPVRRFRFENAWASRDDFLPTVQYAWSSIQQQPDAFFNLHAKLAATARELNRWSSQYTNDLELRAAITSELILRLDQAMDSRQLTDEERQFRALLKVNCLGIAAVQRTMWRQRSRIQWLREGDASTVSSTQKHQLVAARTSSIELSSKTWCTLNNTERKRLYENSIRICLAPQGRDNTP
jgi:hypothetical protein